MRNKAALLIAALFLIGVVELLLLRFEGGDVYPAYSSLRADPFGTKALYESLEKIPGATVARHFKPLEGLEGEQGVVFYMGVDPWRFRHSSSKDLARLVAVVQNGARLVIGFKPLLRLPSTKEEPWSCWGARFEFSPPRKSAGAEEDEPPRETLLYFELPGNEWQTLYMSNGNATAIMRSYGKGSIALVANGYLLSNEALLESRDTRLITSLANGPVRRFTFDEFHLGSSETGSLVALARKYGLSGLAAGLALLFGLFVWQKSSSFLPPREAEEAQALGKSAVSGFVNLLRRGVARADLLALCSKEWRRSLAMGYYCPRAKLKQIDDVVESGKGDPLGAYQRISRILAERNIR